MKRPMTMDEWKKHLEGMEKENPEGKLQHDDVRAYLSSVIAEVAEPVNYILFHDDRVKNYVVFGFTYDPPHDKYAFDVCFKRKDGHYPSDKPLLDVYLEHKNAELEKKVAELKEEIAKLRGNG